MLFQKKELTLSITHYLKIYINTKKKMRLEEEIY